MVHVTPINDLQEHELDPACWCNPRVEEQQRAGHISAGVTTGLMFGWKGIMHQRLLVIHNSADGRELVEKHGVN